MYSFDTFIRPCYADVDQMGFVYYGNYLKFYEIARGETMRALGLSYRGMEEKGVMMPVIKAELSYRHPAHYDDLLRIRTIVKEFPDGVRISFFYEVYHDGSGLLLNEGYTQLAFMRATDHRPCRCPEFLQVLLHPFFDNDKEVKKIDRNSTER